MRPLIVTEPSGVSKEELRREHYNATVVRVRPVHEDLIVMRVRPDFPLLPYRPGQFTSLGLGWWEDKVEGSCTDRLSEMAERLAELDEGLASGEGPLEPPEDGPGGLRGEREELSRQYHRLFQKLIKRAYSISDPMLDEAGGFVDLAEENTLEFYFAVIREGGEAHACPILTPRLALLKEGDRIYLQEKITGLYTLDGLPRESDVVFAATGTGEAPHNAMIARLLKDGHQGRIVSIVCTRYRRDLAYLEVHRRLEETFPDYRYVALTTRDLPPGQRKVYIQDLVRDGALEELLGRPLGAGVHVFLCGNPRMVGAPRRIRGEVVYPEEVGVVELLERGYPGLSSDPKAPDRNIHFETYW